MNSQIITNNLDIQLTKLKKSLFTGRLLIQSDKKYAWEVFFYLGRILYATGGLNPMRRWLCNLTLHCFEGDFHRNYTKYQSFLTDISDLNSTEISECWEYYLLLSWLNKKQINREQIGKFIQASIIENFFDIHQLIDHQVKLECILESIEPFTQQLILLDSEQVWLVAKNNWQIWKNHQLGDIFPHQGLMIIQPEKLQATIAPEAYQPLSKVLDGNYSLREIAAHTKHSVTDVAASLFPYIQVGMIKNKAIKDFVAPVSSSRMDFSNQTITNSAPLIVCIDDSPTICQQLELTLNNAGYRYLAITDAIQAIPKILENKPQLIFLDLFMPNTNGYEICAKLRKISLMANVPIIILTGNDGIIDRVRAKVVGATDFLTKPITQEMILKTVNNYNQNT